MNKRSITIGMLVVGILLAGCNKTAQPVVEDQAETVMEGGESEKIDNGMVGEDEFTAELMASNFTFGQDEIRVKVGDSVKIKITNQQGTHDLKLDEFGIATGIIPEGESKVVEFVADKAGEYEYYCSIGNHRAMGMKGMLIVEE